MSRGRSVFKQLRSALGASSGLTDGSGCDQKKRYNWATQNTPCPITRIDVDGLHCGLQNKIEVFKHPGDEALRCLCSRLPWLEAEGNLSPGKEHNRLCTAAVLPPAWALGSFEGVGVTPVICPGFSDACDKRALLCC